MGVSWSRQVRDDVPVALTISRVIGKSGEQELHIAAQPTRDERFEVQLEWLRCATERALRERGCDPGNTVFRRLFCCDIANQMEVLRGSSFANPETNGEACASSWIGQPPPEPARVALWSYLVQPTAGQLEKSAANGTVTVARGALRHHWTTGLINPAGADVDEQTRGAFAAYEAELTKRGLTLADNVLRTWLFVREIDFKYADLVHARRELFAQRGLTAETHYIASTGIEGCPVDAAARLTMDAYAIGGVLPEQVEYIRVPEQLCSTSDYGVTFERATAISYRDRKHVLISGTASIDAYGDVLHVGDVRAQVDRTLENISSLLHKAGAALSDLGILVAYVRNGGDAATVRRRIHERVGKAPLVVVTGAVCRPEWLVEMEGQAIVANQNPALPPY